MRRAFTEEELLLYADGRLDSKTVEEIESALATDSELRRQVELLQISARTISLAYDRPMHEPPPSRLLETIERAGRETAVTEAGAGRRAGRQLSLRVRIFDAWSALIDSLASSPIRLGAALSAALLIGIGLGQNWTINGRTPMTDILSLGRVQESTSLAHLLEKQPSGESIATEAKPGERRKTVAVATFHDRAGRACRELEVLSGKDAATPTAAAIACRRSDGGWQIEGIVQIGSVHTKQEGYELSGGEEADVMEGLLQALGASETLTSADELALIKRRWSQ